MAFCVSGPLKRSRYLLRAASYSCSARSRTLSFYIRRPGLHGEWLSWRRFQWQVQSRVGTHATRSLRIANSSPSVGRDAAAGER
ncbi:hypothetical protein E2562_014462 [Oryza meyeriana var. granulata]|uniref:Uncharacterized protein n=1 Tax=Oryza meyeriana var. granulata TaxID=110450 RepID=A0A6G1CRD3_9ORYZ|nr:hypothetical protein E2562_014462 [Oryza meyeriana var. granulata]